MKHLFVDISSHGLGHLAQTAPVLNALLTRQPMQLTLRSGLTQEQLARRIHHPFVHIHEASDFGFVMHDALNVNLEVSAERYRQAYAHWPQRVAEEAALFESLAPDLVLSNVSPLPLAGATKAGIPALAMCSLNWADLFFYYYDKQEWAQSIYAAMHQAYAGTQTFLRFTPGMDMPTLPNMQAIGPVSVYAQGKPGTTRAEAARRLGLPVEKRWLLLALGGISHRLPVEDWPELPNTQLLVPADWNVGARSDVTACNDELLPFAELLPVVDAVLSKPGYGTFVEAACCGLPVIYLRRPDWPEANSLEQWLHRNTRAAIISPAEGASGTFAATLDTLLRTPAPPLPVADGLEQALHVILFMINQHLDEGARIKP